MIRRWFGSQVPRAGDSNHDDNINPTIPSDPTAITQPAPNNPNQPIPATAVIETPVPAVTPRRLARDTVNPPKRRRGQVEQFS